MDIIISLESLAGLIDLNGDGAIKASLMVEGTETLKTKEEIDDIVKNAAVEKLRVIRKAGYDEGHKIGEKRTATKLEKTLSEDLGIKYEEGKTVKEIAEAWHESQTAKGGTASSKLTPESVKAHPTYIEDMRAEMQKRTTIETDFNTYKNEVSTKEVRSKIESLAIDALDKAGFVIPENAEKRKRQFGGFIDELTKDLTFEFNGDAVAKILKGSEKTPVQNELMHDITFYEHATSVGKNWFDPKTDDGRSSPGATTQRANPGGPYKGPAVKSSEEFFQQLGKIEKLEDKQAFKNQYAKQLETGFTTT
jgi:hypothetical protein